MNMTLTMYEIRSMLDAFNAIKDEKIPFPLTLILLKNREKLEGEFKFFTSRMGEIAQKYFQVDEEKQDYKRSEEGGFYIKAGMEKECSEEIDAVTNFEVTIDLKQIPARLMKNMNLSINQVGALSKLFIDDSEEEK